MKKTILKTSAFIRSVTLIFGLSAVFFFGSCATKNYEPSEVVGKGAINVNSEYTVYQNVTRTREVYVPGTATYGVTGVTNYSESRIETETYTETIPVKMDRKLPFKILKDNVEIFRGVSPVTVTNLNPGVRYIIVWRTVNGADKSAWFEIPTSFPFTRFIYIE